jgi:hypothetical protein
MTAFAILASAVLAGGCVSPTLSAAQIDALHAKRYEASPDAVFTATSNALIDLGYHVALTDSDGGILAAERRQDPSILEHAAVLALTTLITLGQAPALAPPAYFTMCVIVSEDGAPEASVVRFEVYRNGDQIEEQQRMEELFLRIERRLLIVGELWNEPVDPGAP